MDLQALRKKKPATETESGDPYEQLVRNFVSLIMAKLLAREFEEQYVYARHPAWKTGPWKGGGADGPVPTVAIGTPDGKLGAVLEVETERSLGQEDVVARWKKLATGARLDLVVPKSLQQTAVTKAREGGIEIHDVWTYAITPSKQVTVVKATENPEALVTTTKAEDEIVVY